MDDRANRVTARYGWLPWVAVSLLILVAGAALGQVGAKSQGSSYLKELEAWRESRLQELTAEDGWLSLVGLFWLRPGQNKVGTDTSNDIILPAGKAPAFSGSIWLEGGALRFEAEKGAAITIDGKPAVSLALQTDAAGKPTVVDLGSLSFYVIKRGDRLGVRVKDKKSAARFQFRGIESYPVDLKWRIQAKFEPYNPPKKIPIVNVLGMVDDEPSPGAISFELGGKTYRLDALLEGGSNELFVIFGDSTNGRETYGAGRYLHSPAPSFDGKVTIDFNKAYNPPCAFTKYATCPLPPRQNRLPMAVAAGEKTYHHGAGIKSPIPPLL